MPPSSFRLPRLLTTGALATTLALGLAACNDGDSEDAAQSTASSASTDSSTGSAEGTGAAGASGEEAEQGAVTLEDGYVGAKDSDTAMTAVFGSLTNHTDTDIHGGFNRSSQHLDLGGVQRWQRQTGTRRPVTYQRSFVGSGVPTGRCGRRCVHLAVRSRPGRYNVSSGD